MKIIISKTDIEKLGKFVSKTDTRYILQGVSFIPVELADGTKGVEFAATNGSALLKITRPLAADEMLPEKIILKLPAKIKGPFIIISDINGLYMGGTINDEKFVCEKIDGVFPNYNAVLPDDFHKKPAVEKYVNIKWQYAKIVQELFTFAEGPRIGNVENINIPLWWYEKIDKAEYLIAIMPLRGC